MVFYSSYKRNVSSHNHGLTLVELLVAIGLMGIVFVGIISGFRLALDISYSIQAKAVAISLANEQIEYVRSLPYEEVGTEGGIPAGDIVQVSTTTINNQTFTIKNLVRYVDNPADGAGSSDINGITTDYKEVKATVSWPTRRGGNSVSLVSTITPEGVETSGGGGTLRINVYDADLAPLSGATVQILNTTTDNAINVSQQSNNNGVVEFGGTPEASQYEVLVSRAGYSSAQTYQPSNDLSNPDTKPLTVIAGTVSSASFQIDRLGNMNWNFFTAAEPERFTDSFATTDSVAASSSVVISDSVVLEQDAAGYVSSGWLDSVQIAPVSVSSWETVRVSASTTADTAVRYQVTYTDSGGEIAILPDEVLSGNSAGFLPGTISLRGVSVAEYPSLGMRALLQTNVAQQTPELQEWSITYHQSLVPEVSVPVRLYGSKSIGTDGEGATVYKYDESHTTDVHGGIALPNMEWDSYRVELPETRVITRACPTIPYSLQPNGSQEVDVFMQNAPAHSLRVQVQNASGQTVPGAVVQLASVEEGVAQTETTGGCGQVFFGTGLGQADDYEVTVSAAGYSDTVISNVTVEGSAYEVISLDI